MASLQCPKCKFSINRIPGGDFSGTIQYVYGFGSEAPVFSGLQLVQGRRTLRLTPSLPVTALRPTGRVSPRCSLGRERRALTLLSVGGGFYNAWMRKRNTATKIPAAKILASATSAPGTTPNTPPQKKPGQTTKPQGARQIPPDPARVAEIFRRFEAANPHPKGELDYVNPFTLLVAVVLSAQATDTGVNKATPALFAAADSPEKMLALGEEKLRDMIKTIGLYRTKAKNVIALSQRLVKDFGGEVPRRPRSARNRFPASAARPPMWS